MELDDVDIKLLEEAIENGYKDFHCEGGFFWGHQFQEESVKDYAEKDRELFKEAITKLDQRLYFLEEQMKEIKSDIRNKR